MPSPKRTLLPALLLALISFPVQAQTRDRGPIVLEIPASSRALALGNAFALGFGDPDAIFYHPSQLNRIRGIEATLRRFGANGTFTALSAGQSWYGGGVALGLQQLTYEASLDPNPLAGDILGLPADEASLRDVGQTALSETVLSAGYGKSLLGAQMGVVGKLVEQRAGSRKAGTAALDVGLAVSPGPVTLGVAVQNLGPGLQFAGEEIGLPTRFSVGASTQTAMVGPLDLSASSVVSYRMDGDVVPSVGLEVAYWPITGRTFVGRVGYRHLSDDFSAVPITFGAAFKGDNIVLEYAFQGYDSGDPSHSFSLGWR
jgi:hypothetical protein